MSFSEEKIGISAPSSSSAARRVSRAQSIQRSASLWRHPSQKVSTGIGESGEALSVIYPDRMKRRRTKAHHDYASLRSMLYGLSMKAEKEEAAYIKLLRRQKANKMQVFPPLTSPDP
ncbi:hypothetical protein AB6A40_000904 [Gnathostoma spinigerum]|uniref:Uncharacterized protein n=1 Tax=Gnathostoma spinigerum TaxID=75299 RepID=A0ABD6E306_9BILA